MNNSQSINELSKISSRNQIVIPSKIRKAMNLKSGDSLYWSILNTGKTKKILAEPKPVNWAIHSRGLGKHIWKNVDIVKYIKNIREEWEDKKL